MQKKMASKTGRRKMSLKKSAMITAKKVYNLSIFPSLLERRHQLFYFVF